MGATMAAKYLQTERNSIRQKGVHQAGPIQSHWHYVRIAQDAGRSQEEEYSESILCSIQGRHAQSYVAYKYSSGGRAGVEGVGGSILFVFNALV